MALVVFDVNNGSTGAQGPAGPAGVEGLVWRSTYNASTAYTVDDAVAYNGSSYICTQAGTGNVPTNASFWNLLAEKGATGLIGSIGF